MVKMLEREMDHHLVDMMVEHLAVMLGQSEHNIRAVR